MSIPKRGRILGGLLSEASEKNILDLGCGAQKTPGAVGIDFIAAKGVDIIHDLSEFPWPLPDDKFDLVVFKHAVEHVPDIPRTMEEIRRVSKNGAKVYVETPHYTNNDSWGDPSHVRHLNSRSMQEFCGEAAPTMKELVSYVELKGKWKTFKLEWMINRVNDKPDSKFWRKSVRDRWEKYYSFIIRGGNMFFVLEVKK